MEHLKYNKFSNQSNLDINYIGDTRKYDSYKSNSPKQIKKFRNAYMIFCSEIRNILKNNNINYMENTKPTKNIIFPDNLNSKILAINSTTNSSNVDKANNDQFNISVNEISLGSERLINHINKLNEDVNILKTIPNNVLTKKIAFLWKSISINEKQIYFKKEKEEKEVFEMKKRDSGLNYKYKKCEKLKRPIRFRTPYMFYVKEHKYNMQNKEKFENIEYIKSISELWKKMKYDEKLNYTNLAIEDKKRYDYEYDIYMKHIFSVNCKRRNYNNNNYIKNNKRSEKIEKMLLKFESGNLTKSSKFNLVENKRSNDIKQKSISFDSFVDVHSKNYFKNKKTIDDNSNTDIMIKIEDNPVTNLSKYFITYDNNQTENFLNKKKPKINKHINNIFFIEKTKRNKNNRKLKISKSNTTKKTEAFHKIEKKEKLKLNKISINNINIHNNTNYNYNQSDFTTSNDNNNINFSKFKFKENSSEIMKYDIKQENSLVKVEENHDIKRFKINEDKIKEKFHLLKSSINNFVSDSNRFLNSNSTPKTNFNHIYNNSNNINTNNSIKNMDNIKVEENLTFENSPNGKYKNAYKLSNGTLSNFNKIKNNNNNFLDNYNNEPMKNKEISLIRDSSCISNGYGNTSNNNSNLFNNEFYKSKNSVFLRNIRSSYKKSADQLDNILGYEINNSNLKGECMDNIGDSLDLDISMDLDELQNDDKSYS